MRACVRREKGAARWLARGLRGLLSRSCAVLGDSGAHSRPADNRPRTRKLFAQSRMRPGPSQAAIQICSTRSTLCYAASARNGEVVTTCSIFKTGIGGIVEAEFLVQALQMRHDVRENFGAAGDLQLATLFRPRIPPCSGCSYEFLRHLETVLRRWRNTSASSLPPDPIEQRKLAIRMGFKSREDWQQAYESARADIHAICGKHFVG